MIFGIKYKSNSKGLKIMNYCMQKYGGGIWINGKCDLYFTNPIEAFLMSRKLTKTHENLNYSVFLPTAEERKKIAPENIVHNRDEYNEIVDARTKDLIELLEQQRKFEEQTQEEPQA